MTENEQLLTREFLRSLIAASEKADTEIKERGWTTDDDAWDDAGAAGQMQWQMAENMAVTAMLARVLIAETGVWKRDETVELYTSGKAIDYIANEFEVSAQTIRKWLADAGCPIRPGGRPQGSKDTYKRRS